MNIVYMRYVGPNPKAYTQHPKPEDAPPHLAAQFLIYASKCLGSPNPHGSG